MQIGSDWIDVCSRASCWQLAGIGSCNGFASNRRQSFSQANNIPRKICVIRPLLCGARVNNVYTNNIRTFITRDNEKRNNISISSNIFWLRFRNCCLTCSQNLITRPLSVIQYFKVFAARRISFHSLYNEIRWNRQLYLIVACDQTYHSIGTHVLDLENQNILG